MDFTPSSQNKFYKFKSGKSNVTIELEELFNKQIDRIKKESSCPCLLPDYR